MLIKNFNKRFFFAKILPHISVSAFSKIAKRNIIKKSSGVISGTSKKLLRVSFL
jgi:hypothetical protein